jgi:uncharacterized protein YfdQ (DUF2303 family)
MGDGTVADRTGELMLNAMAIVEKYHEPSIVQVIDPLTGESAMGTMDRENGLRAIDPSFFDGYRSTPVRINGNAAFTRLESLIAHILRFKVEDSAIFAIEGSQPSVYAIYDYHDQDQEGENVADWCSHKATYQFPLSKEWQAWTRQNATPMNMVEFALFLENHIIDVDATDIAEFSDEMKQFASIVKGKLASPSKLIELAAGLKIHEKSSVTDVRNLSSGEAEIAFTSEHTDANGNKLDIPNLFAITIPVFARSPDVYRILARLRYRKNGDGLKFWFELWRADRVLDHAFGEACDKLVADTGLPLFFGQHEG